jgi:hypothetical protein
VAKSKRSNRTAPAPTLNSRSASRLSGAILLVGVGVIAALGVGWWPWLLVLFALSMVPLAYARSGVSGGLFAVYWVVGLLIISAADVVWPGILFVIGLSLVARFFVQPRRR